LTADGGTFRVVQPPDVDALLPALEEVSNEWLRDKAAAEKGFSLGFFARDYVRRFPVALVERNGRIEAFANIWTADGRHELSVDLMRHRESPIHQLMDGLFVHLFLWAQSQGYEYFNLGMAPLSGLGESPVAPLWARVANLVFEHGERFYNFQGLRAYKEKFHPQWEPRYLAYPGRLTLAPILADVSALVAGGYRRMVFG
jgi:phosphatidylglycerol lysyltransferase